MKMIIGLGNPGRAYEKNRHNFGFMVLDKLAEIQDKEFTPDQKHKSETLKTEIKGEATLLVKPQTFMNNSGQAAASLSHYYKIPVPDILLVYDDVDLNFGDIKTTGRSSAGHRGVESVFQMLGTTDIPRVRLGINSGSAVPTENFVTQDFNDNEEDLLDVIIGRAIKEILAWYG